MSQTIDLTLDGLSCGHCVKRVKESLEQRPDVEQADVSVTEAHVTGTARQWPGYGSWLFVPTGLLRQRALPAHQPVVVGYVKFAASVVRHFQR